MIWHVIERLKSSKFINEIILAIPETKKNDVLETFCKKHDVKFFKGSEDDVLARYHGAAQKFNCDIVVRVTSDCPLIDPKIVDKVIKKHLKTGVDYTSNIFERTFPRGLDTEVFNFKILNKTFKEAKEKHQREHVTPFVWEQPNVFKIGCLKANRKLNHPEYRWTVDVKEDLKMIRKIFKILYKPNKFFSAESVIDLLNERPEIAEINAKVEQKKLKA